MDKRAGPVAEISLERGEISLTGMEISPYKGRTIRKVKGGGGQNQKKNLFPAKN
jgi:hypothetical protein